MSNAAINILHELLHQRDVMSLIDDALRVVPAMVHSLDGTGRIQSVSDLWLRKLGYKRHQVIGRKTAEFLTPESSRYATDHVLPKFFRDGHCDDIEYQMVCANGDILDVMLSGVLHELSDGRKLSLAFITDVTAQKLAERKLTESEARYRSIVEDQTELVALANPDLTILFVNGAYARHHGISACEMIGRSMFDFVPTHCHAQVRAHMERAMQAIGTLQDENEVFLPDGSMRWISWSNRAIRSADGKVTAVHSVGRDIHERKQAELRLAESEARYRILADHSSDMVFQFDLDLVRQYVSPACREILGREPEELIGAKALTVLHPDEADDLRTAFSDIAHGRRERGSFRHRIQHKDGRWIWVEAAVRATRDPVTGQAIGLIGALRDVSATKEVEAKLEDANRRLEVLAAQDGLTQMFNRRSFDEMLAREIKIARREGSSLSLLMIDVDAFKAYNDHYGHLAGDGALRQVGAAISAGVKRPGDLCARYGGEEFVVLLPNTETAGALQVAETIRRNVQQLQLKHETSAWQCVTVSIGVATANNAFRDSLSQDMLLKRADKALYTAKNGGRNTVASWQPRVPAQG
jgi:diguanylate cyclase (GGDEF)-like protein/PAS domain S-box-containing protein